jgi:hypothetical protein
VRSYQLSLVGAWRSTTLDDAPGVLVSIDNCDRVESLSALPRRLPGVLP